MKLSYNFAIILTKKTFITSLAITLKSKPSNMKKKIAIILTVLIIVAISAYFLIPKNSNNEAVEYETSTVSSQRLTQSITATGTVEPVTQVEVGTQVSGILTSLYVDYNSVVKKGEIIAELDKSTLILDLNNKKNNVLVSKSKFDYELANYTRVKTLYEKKLIADSEYEQALYNYETSKNNYEISKNDLQRSETNLGYATIYSPIDGVVLSRSVEEGQTVASSFNTPTLFTIAADLKDMRVIANIDEADIGNVKEGQKAKFSVDAFPDLEFEGEVTQIRQEAIIESNVVTYEVVISAANPDLKLKPGLTATIEVYTLDTLCSTTIPVAALSFTPAQTEAVGGQMERGERMERMRKEGNLNPEERRKVEGERGGETGPRQGQGPKSEKRNGGQMVWIKNNNQIEPRRVKVGVNNGILAEVSGLQKGDEVIIGITNTSAPKKEGANTENNPFMPQRPGGRR